MIERESIRRYNKIVPKSQFIKYMNNVHSHATNKHTHTRNR